MGRPVQLLITTPFSIAEEGGGSKTYVLSLEPCYLPSGDLALPTRALRSQIRKVWDIDESQWTAYVSGKSIDQIDYINVHPIDESAGFLSISVVPRLLGGKGGFGTLLRGKGARGPRTSNFESARDLQGRRLRNARAPERMRQWVERKVHESDIIKAVGGEDPFIGKSLSAEDVIRLYKLQLTPGTFNPYNNEAEEDEFKKSMTEQSISAAAEAIMTCQERSPIPPGVLSFSESLPEGQDELFNSYLDCAVL